MRRCARTCVAVTRNITGRRIRSRLSPRAAPHAHGRDNRQRAPAAAAASGILRRSAEGVFMAKIPARAALEALRAGNRRFVSKLGLESGAPLEAGAVPPARRELPSEQEPLAIVLGCSDARVPAEIVFDQGLGDLF